MCVYCYLKLVNSLFKCKHWKKNKINISPLCMLMPSIIPLSTSLLVHVWYVHPPPHVWKATLSHFRGYFWRVHYPIGFHQSCEVYSYEGLSIFNGILWEYNHFREYHVNISRIILNFVLNNLMLLITLFITLLDIYIYIYNQTFDKSQLPTTSKGLLFQTWWSCHLQSQINCIWLSQLVREG